MANPYRNTGRAGTGSPANFTGWVKAAGKFLKRFGKAPKPKSNFKPFHRDGITYDTKSINQQFENRFGPPKPTVEKPKPTDGWGMTGDEPLTKNPHWLGDADPYWDPVKQRPKFGHEDFLTPVKSSRSGEKAKTAKIMKPMKPKKDAFDKILPPASAGIGYSLAKNEQKVKEDKAKQKLRAASQGR